MSGFTYDSFVAQMPCPVCGELSPPDDSTGMQTAIRAEPQLAWLAPGDALSIEPAEMPQRGYLPVRPAADPTHLLQTWSCPSCGASGNWADVTVRGGTIESIVPTPLDRAALSRAHFIDSEAKGVAAALSDRAFAEVPAEEVVPLLERLLP